jgi:acyl transferase domain-containing protein/acyl carrier protein
MSVSGPDRRALLKEALDAVERLQARVDALESQRAEPIAIIGLACRFPGGASTPEAYWALLRDGIDAVTEVPADRWDAQTWARLAAPGNTATKYYGGFLEDIDRFDPQFFGISPREASTMDPQQRLLLEVVWEALERAGQAPDRLAGSRTGVFVGITTSDYSELVRGAGSDALDVYVATGNAHNVAAGRVSYVLGLRGPCMAVDTACSSSLTAVHLACQSLRAGESRMALAGGVNAILTLDPFLIFSRWGMMAPDGRCKTFDSRADGFVRGEGCGVLVLKRLSDAVADGDTVLAVIRGSAVNQDGASSGLTVPNGLAQQEVVRQALAGAGVAPADVSYVEAHGTGTALGDPIELEALLAVLGQGRPATRPLTVGSVKTNLGHLESASGVAGLIKVVLSLQHGEIPPHLHFTALTPKVTPGLFPLVVPTRRTPWPSGGGPRVAGVSSFGFGGTNAHVVLEEPPIPPTSPVAVERPRHLLLLSARSDAALDAQAERLTQHLEGSPDSDMGDTCFTLATGRARLPHRLAAVVKSAADASTALATVGAGRIGRNVRRGRAPASRPKVAFLFSGQGSQYVGMGRGLYDTCVPFRRALEHCEEILSRHLDRSLSSLLYPAAGEPSQLDETRYTQPALFALEYALAETWRDWGVTPAFVLGHSIGEYVAACVAGVLTLEDALAVVVTRARLMQELRAGGAMAAVFADEATVARAIEPYTSSVALAAVNGPDNVVVSGDGAVVAGLLERLQQGGIRSQPLAVSHAFHSPLMDPILDALEDVVARAALRPARIALVSNVSGRMVTGDELLASQYWRRHARQPVQFSAGMSALHAAGAEIFVELGPSSTLLGMARHCLPGAMGPWLPSLRKGRDDWEQMLESLGALHVEGVDVDWAAFDLPYERRRIVLPTYEFQRDRYWMERVEVEPPVPGNSASPDHALRGHRLASPKLADAVFEYRVAASSPAFLREHRLHGTVVFPGTAYVETILGAAEAVFPTGHPAIESLVIREPLVLAEEATRTVQVIVSRDAATPRAEVFSRPSDPAQSDAWILHAAATISVGAEPACDSAGVLGESRARCREVLSVSTYYQTLGGIGLGYGPTFRGLRELWRGDGEAVGRVELDPTCTDARSFIIHPALLDACFQLFGPILAQAGTTPSEEAIFIPFAIERFVAHTRAGSTVWARVALRHPHTGADTVQGDLHLFDETGAVVACAHGVMLRRLSRAALRLPAVDVTRHDWLYEPTWVAAAGREAADSDARGSWLIFADRRGVADALIPTIGRSGGTCVVVERGDGFRALEGGRFQVDPHAVSTFTQLAQATGLAFGIRGVIYLWGLDLGATDDPPGVAALDGRGLPGLLHLVQTVAGLEAGGPRTLAIVTRGGQAVTPSSTEITLAAAPLWGFGRSLIVEAPALGCRLFDLDPDADPVAGVPRLVREILAADADEPQVAWRHSERLVFRIVQAPQANASNERAPCALVTQSPGVLDGLVLQSATVTPPAPGEVQIRVDATGLNFRDVMNALGLYPGEAGPLGSECVGEITALGAGVHHLQTGQRVMAITAQGFSTFVNARADATWPVPEGLSLLDAATVPIAFLTALYALDRVAGVRPGERVLIHAAAGGVGLAAVQVARRNGAEVFATAGSPEKRQFLRDLGIAHAMDSRALDFADEIMAATGGEGVDVVLNSLTGPSIGKSLSVLRQGGRFLEIGKTELLDEAQVAATYPGVSYSVIFLGDVCQRQPALVQLMIEELGRGFASGALHPLPCRVFDIAEARAAFRYMAQARHIGKVVVSQGQRRPVEICAEATYLVTGGLGGLGLEVAGWLVERGARHLTLMGRRPPSEQARQRIAALEARGASVTVALADVADRGQIEALLASISVDRPLRGIVHAAGVLDDGVVGGQTIERLSAVMAPKAAGAWHLHAATQHRALDFFVLFSSSAALFGAAGQSSYAAANAFLDALAHARRAVGLPALSVNWGPWAEVGMAARLDERERRNWARRGIQMIRPAEGTALLGTSMELSRIQLAVLPIDWTVLGGAGKEPSLLAAFRPDARIAGDHVRPREQEPELRVQLAHAAPSQRRGLLVRHVVNRIAAVLRLADPDAIDLDQPLVELGIDSLMALELRNTFARGAGCPLPATLLFDCPTPGALASLLASKLLDGAEPRTADRVEELRPAAAIGDCSEEELVLMLSQKLDALMENR